MSRENQTPLATPIFPFLKWAGGKRWLTAMIEDMVGEVSGRYIEPFLGSGAVFFKLSPSSAVLNDLNRDLIETYQAIKADYAQVYKHLHFHQRKHNSDYYYQIRLYNPRCPYRRAARFIYLNRTCWNGLYRVNLKGEFNVPIGTKSTVILPSDNWAGIANVLSGAELTSGDYQNCIDGAMAGDLIFADPPYTIKHNFNGFIKYNESLFSWQDQERLSLALTRAAMRGVKVVATNAYHESVKALYSQDCFTLHSLTRNSVLSGKPEYRGKYQELLVTSFGNS